MQEQSYCPESKLTFVPGAFTGLYRGFHCYLLIHHLSVFNALIFISPANLAFTNLYVVVIQLLSHFQLFMTQWTTAHHASLSFTVSSSLLRFMSIESVMLSNHLILCRPLIFLLSIFPSIRVFSSESALHIRWPKYWSFSISPSNEYSQISFNPEYSLLKLKLQIFIVCLLTQGVMGGALEEVDSLLKKAET